MPLDLKVTLYIKFKDGVDKETAAIKLGAALETCEEMHEYSVVEEDWD